MKKETKTFDKKLLLSAFYDSFVKLNPRKQIKNPVMFIVFLGAVITTIITFTQFTAFNFQISIWLWFTVLFANISEAVAEGRGKAQAESLKKMRTNTYARLMIGSEEKRVLSSELNIDDVVVCEIGDIIPGDGEVIEGIASVDESAITGESAPVIRESGGDRSAVTGGTKVISDRIVIRITSKQGDTFLDKMIALVEGAKRQKTPNEIALTILLSGMTIIFLLAVVTLKPFELYALSNSANQLSNLTIPVLISLLVCLIPTTIGGLLSAIGISGIDRLTKRNVIAKSGKAVEAAGDVDVLLLDKTGTITLGNRMATEFVTVKGVEQSYLAEISQLSSLADETPEGRSIVKLAKRVHGKLDYGLKFLKISEDLGQYNTDLRKDEAEFGKNEAEFGKDEAEFGKDEAEFGKRGAEFGKKGAEFGKRGAEFEKDEAEFGKDEAEFGKDEAEFVKDEAEFGKDEAIIMNSEAVIKNNEFESANKISTGINPQLKFIPFTAQTKMSGVDITINNEVRMIRKGASDSIKKFVIENGGSYPQEVNTIVENIAKEGSTPLVVCENNKIVGVIRLKDIVKGGIKERFDQLRKMGIKTVMITGDNPLTAVAIATEAGVDDFIAEATPEDKLNRIREEQANGKLVAMIGDGTNDAPALAQADVGVAMNTGTQAAREAGNMVDLDSNPTKLIDVVEIGKQLLMTRGSLTTFSIANDVAKYFAILPAIFGSLYIINGTGVLSKLNVMGLVSPESAILSSVIFNALIIIALIPLALKGVKYQAKSASSVLRRNIFIYGLGGLIVPFVGIKVIDIVINLLGLI